MSPNLNHICMMRSFSTMQMNMLASKNLAALEYARFAKRSSISLPSFLPSYLPSFLPSFPLFLFPSLPHAAAFN